jgi:hypothetical protein
MRSTASRRAFLTGSAVAVGGLAIAGRLVFVTGTKILTGQAAADSAALSRRTVRSCASCAATDETMSLYMSDLPQPPPDTR